jgi:hypothetical protein
MTERIFRYVPWSRFEDYLKLGWLPAADLGAVHGSYATLMEWRCRCKLVEPQ